MWSPCELRHEGRACTLELINPAWQLSRENTLPHVVFEEFVGPAQAPSGQEITLKEKHKMPCRSRRKEILFSRSYFSPNLINLKACLIWWFCLTTVHSSLINSLNNLKSFQEKTELGSEEKLEAWIRVWDWLNKSTNNQGEVKWERWD